MLWRYELTTCLFVYVTSTATFRVKLRMDNATQ